MFGTVVLAVDRSPQAERAAETAGKLAAAVRNRSSGFCPAGMPICNG